MAISGSTVSTGSTVARASAVLAVVLDASAVAAFIFPDEPDHAPALRLLADLTTLQKTGGARLLAPPLFQSEADSIIRRREYLGAITAVAAQAAYRLLDAVPLEIVQDDDARIRARQMAAELNQVRVYDATYAALAERRSCDFWTDDEKFYRAAQSTLPFVRYVAHYAGEYASPAAP